MNICCAARDRSLLSELTSTVSSTQRVSIAEALCRVMCASYDCSISPTAAAKLCLGYNIKASDRSGQVLPAQDCGQDFDRR